MMHWILPNLEDRKWPCTCSLAVSASPQRGFCSCTCLDRVQAGANAQRILRDIQPLQETISKRGMAGQDSNFVASNACYIQPEMSDRRRKGWDSVPGRRLCRQIGCFSAHRYLMWPTLCGQAESLIPLLRRKEKAIFTRAHPTLRVDLSLSSSHF